ncbi:hypothetical protein QUA54_26735 [Microcoleus sp. MOSTC5]|uniref:hypothetical protein n=1 Tax=Microcoleus sp. MOSTC5 TaxID=3055378 RepID=UPI002FD6FF04
MRENELNFAEFAIELPQFRLAQPIISPLKESLQLRLDDILPRWAIASDRRNLPQHPLAVRISLYSQWPTCLFVANSYTLSS